MPKKTNADIDDIDLVDTEDTEDTEKVDAPKKGGKKKANPRDLVPYRPARAEAGEDPNLYVAVNGKAFLLPKGKISMIPRYVYDEIMRSERAMDIMAEHEEEFAEKARQSVTDV